MPGFPFLKWEEYLSEEDGFFFPPKILRNKSPALQLSTQIWSGCRSSNQKPVSHLGSTSLPRQAQFICFAALQTSRCIGGATQLPSPLSGCLTGHARVGARSVVWQRLHSIAAAGAPTTITPGAAVLWTGRCLGLCWGHSSNTLISTPATRSRPLQTWLCLFLVAELFLNRKI